MDGVSGSTISNVKVKDFKNGIIAKNIRNSTFQNIRAEGLKISEKLHVPHELVIGIISAVIGAGI